MSAPNDDPRQAPRYHANAMAAHGGPFDVTFDFGYRADPAEDPELQVRVTTSWEHVVVMVKAMQDMVEKYETQVGKIPDLQSVKMTEESSRND